MSTSYIAGAAMIPMGKYPEASYTDLAVPAVKALLKQTGIERGAIDAVYCSHSFGGMLVGQRVAKNFGIGGVPVVNVENACSGGATAVHLAHVAVSEGRHDCVLVVGVDQLTQFGGGALPLVADDPEVRQGMVMPALYAMRARRFLIERDARPEDLAAVSVKARRHAEHNPIAQMRKQTTVEEVLASRPVADPLTLFQCCPMGDGAAAVLVVSERKRRELGGFVMEVIASVLHSGKVLAGFRDMLVPTISVHSAQDCYAQAGLGPDDIDCVELHDAFSIAELVYYEALGLCPKGEALNFLHSGASTYGGKTVVNPSGGLLAKGHPVGASGVAQVVEMFLQLGGEAGRRQVDGAQTGMTHVTGGGIAGLDHGSCCMHIFQADR